MCVYVCVRDRGGCSTVPLLEAQTGLGQVVLTGAGSRRTVSDCRHTNVPNKRV